MSSLSSRMHRLVKKIDRMEQPRSYSRDTSPASEFSAAAAIARMAGKKKGQENISLQIEVETEVQWKALLRREGLIVVDVYASWAGPCSSMISILKRIKVEVNEDRLWLATACSDNISELLGFKDESEPTWLFMAAGKPVKVFRGSNAPKLISLIKTELKHEIKCLQGKAKRTFIHIDDEVGRRRKAEEEALKLAAMVKDEDNAAEKLNSLRRESSTRLMNSLEPYTILVIQNFLLETGAVTEVRDNLIGEFKIEQERYVHLDEDGVRKLFRIPREIPDATVKEPTEVFFADPTPPGELESTPSTEAEPGEITSEAPVETSAPASPAPKPKKMIHVECPDSIIGNTLIMLLECIEVKEMLKAGVKLDDKNPLKSADDYIQIKVGPIKLEDAQEKSPESLHALYGKGGYEYGVWCPRRYDDKRYAMINFFPGFVTEMLMPQGEMEPKYRVAIFEASKADVIPNELQMHNKSVLGQRKLKLPKEVVDAILSSEPIQGGVAYEQKKKAFEAKEVYAVSVDRRNSDIMLTLKSQEPIHISVDQKAGRLESAKLFASLNISLNNGSDAEVKKFLGRGPSRIGEDVVETHKAPPPEPEVEQKESETFE